MLLLLKVGLYSLLLFPLVFWKPLDFFFNSTKAFFIIVISELLFVGYLWLIYRKPQWRPRMDAVTKVFLIFFAMIILVSVLGVDPFLSFWASTARLDGVLMWLHLVVVFFVLSSLLRDQKEWNVFFAAHCVIALCVSLIFLFTRLDPTFMAYAMGGATTGNSTYLGAYLLFSIFFASVLATGGHERWMRRFGFFSVVSFVLLIFATSALAAKGVLLGASILAPTLFMLFCTKPMRAKRILGTTIIMVLCLLFVYVAVSLFLPSSYVNNSFLSFTGGARLEVWKIAWAAFLERPLFGWGLENFPYAFAEHFIPCFGSSACGEEIWFDRAHNKILDLLVEGGVVLLVSYISLLCTSVWVAWKASRLGRMSRHTAVLLITFLTAYFIHNLVEFDVTITYVFFIIVLAYVASMSRNGLVEEVQTISFVRRKMFVILPIIATLALPLTLYHSVIFPGLTNQSLQVVDAVRMPERLIAYEKMVMGSPIGIDYRRVFLAGETVKLFFGLSNDQLNQFSDALHREIKLGIAGLEKSAARAPNTLRVFNLLGLLYHIEGKFYDQRSYTKAEVILRRSLKLNPNNQQAYWPLAAVLLDTERPEEAFGLLDKAIALDERVDVSQFKRLVAIKLTQSQTVFEQEAREILQSYPSLESHVNTLRDSKSGRNMDWLYTIFY